MMQVVDPDFYVHQDRIFNFYLWAFDMEFATNTWISESNKTLYSSRRLLMIDDLFSRHLKVGMPSGAVISLLGTPEAKFGENRWRYELGPSVFGVDFEYLMIEFDTWTRVTKFYIQRS